MGAHLSNLRARRGFTTIELLTVVAILAVLAAVAAPAMQGFLKAQRLRSGAFDLVADLALARSEAMNRNSSVFVTPTASDGNGWKSGWSVNAGTSTGTVVITRTGLAPELRFKALDGGGNAISSIEFARNGRVVGTTPFRVEVWAGATTPQPSCVRIDATGRPRSTKGAC